MADRSLIEGAEPPPRREEAPEWGYEEGVEWGLIFPDANGEYQSPINLNSREAKYDPSLLEVRLSPNYVVCRDCEVINDGHSIQIALKSKSGGFWVDLSQIMESFRLEKTFKIYKANHKPNTSMSSPKPHAYVALTQHLQVDSRQVLEMQNYLKGDLQAAEGLAYSEYSDSGHGDRINSLLYQLHLMHWNSTLYSSIDEAVGKKHGIAIIALFVQIGKEHVGLKAVTEILQDIQYKGKSKTIPCFNPNSLLPDPLLRDYWVYEGSLTIPPCSEGVTWILFRYPLTVSQVQIEEFRRLRTHVKGAELLEGSDGILGDNFRPTQPLSDRIIRAAFQ
ncbi:Carbonic anhydrase-related protein [Pitangus sulphuratus]|nr:Carbonic anhydrase-related protein [Pitangus sulphuratus]